MPFKIAQAGTPLDLHPTRTYGENERNVIQSLAHGETAAFHWDNAYLQPAISIQPVARNQTWLWSGGARLDEKEDYFGLRLR